jgi:CRP-like cAMP-binding protein
MIKYNYKLIIINKLKMENIYELEIFEWIEKDVVDEIISKSKEVSYKKWDIVIMEWNESNWEWYIIKDWLVWISIKSEHITELKNWDIFWEIALLNDENRTATVTALTNLNLIVLDIESLINMINNDTNKINKEILRRIEENLEKWKEELEA